MGILDTPEYLKNESNRFVQILMVLGIVLAVVFCGSDYEFLKM